MPGSESLVAIALALAIGVGAAGAGGVPQVPTIDGEVIGAGVICPQFRLLSGEIISLESLPPAAPALTPGARLRLHGQFARASRCMQGRAFLVQDIAAAPG